MADSRTEALRRLGGPVCPLCDKIGQSKSYYVDEEMKQWFMLRGQRHLINDSTITICEPCFAMIINEVTLERARKAEKLAQRDAMRIWEDRKRFEHIVRRNDGRTYWEACQDKTMREDLREMGLGWMMGNGLFGGGGD